MVAVVDALKELRREAVEATEATMVILPCFYSRLTKRDSRLHQSRSSKSRENKEGAARGFLVTLPPEQMIHSDLLAGMKLLTRSFIKFSMPKCKSNAMKRILPGIRALWRDG